MTVVDAATGRIVHDLRLASDELSPQTLAVDEAHARIFVVTHRLSAPRGDVRGQRQRPVARLPLSLSFLAWCSSFPATPPRMSVTAPFTSPVIASPIALVPQSVIEGPSCPAELPSAEAPGVRGCSE